MKLEDLLQSKLEDMTDEQLQERINLLRRLKIKEPKQGRKGTNRAKRYKDLLGKLTEEEKKLLLEALSDEEG